MESKKRERPSGGYSPPYSKRSKPEVPEELKAQLYSAVLKINELEKKLVEQETTISSLTKMNEILQRFTDEQKRWNERLTTQNDELTKENSALRQHLSVPLNALASSSDSKAPEKKSVVVPVLVASNVVSDIASASVFPLVAKDVNAPTHPLDFKTSVSEFMGKSQIESDPKKQALSADGMYQDGVAGNKTEIQPTNTKKNQTTVYKKIDQPVESRKPELSESRKQGRPAVNATVYSKEVRMEEERKYNQSPHIKEPELSSEHRKQNLPPVEPKEPVDQKKDDQPSTNKKSDKDKPVDYKKYDRPTDSTRQEWVNESRNLDKRPEESIKVGNTQSVKSRIAPVISEKPYKTPPNKSASPPSSASRVSEVYTDTSKAMPKSPHHPNVSKEKDSKSMPSTSPRRYVGQYAAPRKSDRKLSPPPAESHKANKSKGIEHPRPKTNIPPRRSFSYTREAYEKEKNTRSASSEPSHSRTNDNASRNVTDHITKADKSKVENLQDSSGRYSSNDPSKPIEFSKNLDNQPKVVKREELRRNDSLGRSSHSSTSSTTKNTSTHENISSGSKEYNTVRASTSAHENLRSHGTDTDKGRDLLRIQSNRVEVANSNKAAIERPMQSESRGQHVDRGELHAGSGKALSKSASATVSTPPPPTASRVSHVHTQSSPTQVHSLVHTPKLFASVRTSSKFTDDDLATFLAGCEPFHIRALGPLPPSTDERFLLVFEHQVGADRALARNGQSIKGATVRLWKWAPESISALADYVNRTPGSKTVFVETFGVKMEEDPAIVHKYFGDCGKIVDIQFIKDSSTDEFIRRFWIQFDSERAADRAFNYDGSMLCGRPIVIHYARNLKEIE